MAVDLANGKGQDLHTVMLAMEKSNILLQTTVEVRNKVIDAYQEIMRMQV
jgi:flagellar hook-basal body complex protein FliE